MSYEVAKTVHPEDVKAELRKRHFTYVSLGSELGCSPKTISAVIRGARSRRIEAAIAEKLGKKVWEVFPLRYPPAGKN